MDSFDKENVNNISNQEKVVLENVDDRIKTNLAHGFSLELRQLTDNHEEHQAKFTDEDASKNTDVAKSNTTNMDTEWTFLSRDNIQTNELSSFTEISKSQILIAEALDETDVDGTNCKNVQQDIIKINLNVEKIENREDPNDEEELDHDQDVENCDDSEEDANWTDTNSEASSAELVEIENQTKDYLDSECMTQIESNLSPNASRLSPKEGKLIHGSDTDEQHITNIIQHKSSSSVLDFIADQETLIRKLKKEIEINKIDRKRSLCARQSTTLNELVDMIEAKNLSSPFSQARKKRKVESSLLSMLRQNISISSLICSVLAYTCMFSFFPPSAFYDRPTELNSQNVSAENQARNAILWQSFSNILNASGINSSNLGDYDIVKLLKTESRIIGQIHQLRSVVDRYRRLYGDIENVEQEEQKSFYGEYQQIKTRLSSLLKPLITVVSDSHSAMVDSIDNHVTKPVGEYVIPAAKVVHTKIQEAVEKMDENLEKAIDTIITSSFSTLDSAYEKISLLTSGSVEPTRDSESWLNMFKM